MIYTVPLDIAHVRNIRVQPEQQYMRKHIDAGYGVNMCETKFATAVLDEYGQVLLCAGIHEYWPNVAEVWSLVSVNAGRHMTAITRKVKAHLRSAPYGRLHMTTDVGFTNAERWARILGFKHEARLQRFSSEGRDMNMWVMLK